MRKTFIFIANLMITLFSSTVFALDPLWELYNSTPDGNKTYLDTKNSYYKNGKVIIWTMVVYPSTHTMAAIDDGNDLIFDRGITKFIYPCDNTQNWYSVFPTRFFNKEVAVFGDASSLKITYQFSPGDSQDKFRNDVCRKLKPFWKLPKCSKTILTTTPTACSNIA